MRNSERTRRALPVPAVLGAARSIQFGTAFADALLVVGDLRRRDAVLGLQVRDHLEFLGSPALAAVLPRRMWDGRRRVR